MKTLILTIFLLFTTNIFAVRQINGYVRDAESGEVLIGATVSDESLKFGTSTNKYGYFSFQIPDSVTQLEISFVGFATKKIDVASDNILNIKLSPVSDEIQEVEVVRSAPTRLSMNRLTARTVTRLPMVLGESDITRTVQMLPGVTAGTEVTSGYFVRGGDADQNLLLVDGAPIYNAYHMFGLFSTFNSDAINDARFYKGSIPVEYGNCLSSVMDISLREGNSQKYSGEVSIGTFASKFLLEGPIIKDRTSFFVTGRTSMLNVMPEFMQNLTRKATGLDKVASNVYQVDRYIFKDFNAKLNHRFSDRSKMFVSYYSGKDDYSSDKYHKGDPFNFNNQSLSLRYNQILTPKLSANFIAYYSKYQYSCTRSEGYEVKTFDVEYDKETGEKLPTEYDIICNRYLNNTSSIKDWSAKVSFQQKLLRQTIDFGAQYNKIFLKPTVDVSSIIDGVNYDTLLYFDYDVQNIAAFVSDKIICTENFDATLALRADALLTNGRTYFSPQPRVLLNYRLPMNITAKASYARMVQNLHKLSVSSNGSPSDLWVSSNENYAPSTADEAVLGFGVPFLRNKFLFTVEGYYKQMHKLLSYSEGVSFNNGDTDWQKMVEVGKGESYGVEFCLKKEIGKTSGWISYTLSKTTRQFEYINDGCEYPFTFDRNHNIAVVLMQQLGKHFDFGANWVYMSGSRITTFLATYENPVIDDFYYITPLHYNELIEVYSSRNAVKLPPTHRLDVCMNYKAKLKFLDFKASVGVYNLYKRHNPYYVENNNGYEYNLISLFGSIPYLTLDFKF